MSLAALDGDAPGPRPVVGRTWPSPRSIWTRSRWARWSRGCTRSRSTGACRSTTGTGPRSASPPGANGSAGSATLGPRSPASWSALVPELVALECLGRSGQRGRSGPATATSGRTTSGGRRAAACACSTSTTPASPTRRRSSPASSSSTPATTRRVPVRSARRTRQADGPGRVEAPTDFSMAIAQLTHILEEGCRRWLARGDRRRPGRQRGVGPRVSRPAADPRGDRGAAGGLTLRRRSRRLSRGAEPSPSGRSSHQWA